MKIAAPPQYVNPYLQGLNPDEQHNAGGDCVNPKCNYNFTPQDKQDITQFNGDFTCPQCDKSFNYYTDANSPGGFTNAGLSMTRLGNIGEQVIRHLGSLPGLGSITWYSADYHSPIDFVIGKYGCEVKTNHSESTPRFKIGGQAERQAKIDMAQRMGVEAALVGVRLNFYTDLADIFFRPQLTDTWIGNPQLQHVAKVGFQDLNPFRNPEDVPNAHNLPDDDATPASESNEFPF